MSIKLIVDSASDIDQNEADSLNITLMPMEIAFGQTFYYDGVTLSAHDFYQKLTSSNEFPSTSLINQFRFEEAFTPIVEAGDEVLCIVMSSKLSGTYEKAKEASKKFNGKVRVVDSLNATIGERILIQYAMQLISAGKDLNYIADTLDIVKHKIQLVALVDTLKYLQKGGRVSKAIAFTGELLNIKPLISVIDGEVKVIGKALGLKKANSMLIQKVEVGGGIDFNMPFAVAYCGTEDTNMQKFIVDAKGLLKDVSVPTYIIGSTIGTHVGPGAVAIAYFGNNQ